MQHTIAYTNKTNNNTYIKQDITTPTTHTYDIHKIIQTLTATAHTNNKTSTTHKDNTNIYNTTQTTR